MVHYTLDHATEELQCDVITYGDIAISHQNLYHSQFIVCIAAVVGLWGYLLLLFLDSSKVVSHFTEVERLGSSRVCRN